MSKSSDLEEETSKTKNSQEARNGSGRSVPGRCGETSCKTISIHMNHKNYLLILQVTRVQEKLYQTPRHFTQHTLTLSKLRTREK